MRGPETSHRDLGHCILEPMPDREPLRLQARPCVDTTRLSTPLHRIAREYDDRSLGVGLNASAPSLVRRPPALHGSRGTSAPKQQRIGPLTLTRYGVGFPARGRRGFDSRSARSYLDRSPSSEGIVMFTARAFAASSSTSPLAGISIPRRDPGPDDVDIEILYCGVCHSDLHMARNEWAGWPTIYPMRARPRDRRTGQESGRQRHERQGRRHGGGRLHGRLVPDLRQLQGRPRAVLRHGRRRSSPTTRRIPTAPRPRPTAATRTGSSSTRTSCCASRRSWTRPRPRRCCAPASRSTRR